MRQGIFLTYGILIGLGTSPIPNPRAFPRRLVKGLGLRFRRLDKCRYM